MSVMAGEGRTYRRRLLALTAAVAGCVLALWPISRWAETRALTELKERSRHVLSLVTENLRGGLAKHESTPSLLAHNPALVRVLTGSAGDADIRSLNEKLAYLCGVTGALDIYVMNVEGTTVAASNWTLPRSFVGHNFSYRPYFRDAMKGGPSRYFALGTTSKKRGYYFAHPVKDRGAIVGVVVAKLDVAAMEKAWRTRELEIRVVDEDGVIFMSSNPDWVLKTVRPLSPEATRRIEEDHRYDGHELTPLKSVPRSAGAELGTIVSISDHSTGPRRSRPATDFLVQKTAMPEAGWTVQILARTGAISSYVNAVCALFLVTMTALLLAAAYFLERRRRLRNRLALQESIRAELEARVAERTEDLMAANTALRCEVAERRRAEAELLRTQSELVHAGKLAALGQMAAGLSHELNQPLAAIRSYAENGQVFLERGRRDTVKSNLSAIAELTERMARIIRHLRTYARKEPMALHPAAAGRAIREAVALLNARLTAADISVHLDLPEEEIFIIGGDVRLQQVFVNLFANAIDAMEPAPRRELHVRMRREREAVLVIVRDTGCGIETDLLGSVFDPFFTTKEVGDGLGLGLSITYGIIRQFRGTIEARNHEDGGAVFELRLMVAEAGTEAAA